MRHRLPSLSYLRAFEAAARHLNFTRAAAELNLTQTAVSHQIRSLENLLETKLFVRERGSVRLSDAGQDYVSAVRAALTNLALATDRVIDHRKDNVLTVACLSTFAVKCLIPKLRDFRERYPECSLRVKTILSFDEKVGRDYDVAILYGAGNWSGMVSTEITKEEVFPVCSPRLVERGAALSAPSDLRLHTVIRTESQILQDDWSAWLELAGARNITFADEITFAFLFPSMQAAIDGLGVLMGRRPQVDADLASGRLIEPFSVRLSSSNSWYVTAPLEMANLPKVRSFVSWAVEQFRS